MAETPAPRARAPTTEEEIRAYTIGEIKRLDAPIAIVEYDRDWLRSNDADRRLYETAKRELAKRDWKFIQNYADAKTDVVEEILARAMAPDAGA
jgi:hypothetical protein